jgi:hypothetical protein
MAYPEITYRDFSRLAKKRGWKEHTTMTDTEARQVADSLPGITADGVLRVFPGARVVKASKGHD